MDIQRTRQTNPYAAYQTLVERRGLLGEGTKALYAPELLTAPVLKAHMLAHAERYERLGGLVSGVLSTLSELADPGRAPAVHRIARIQVTNPAAEALTPGTPDQAASPTILTTYEQVVAPEQGTRVAGLAGQAFQGLNQYLDALKSEQAHLPRIVQRFGSDLTRTLQQEQETLSGLGIRVKQDRLVVDEGALDQAVRRDPQGATTLFQRLYQALEPGSGAQAFALNEMRSAIRATSETASTITQVAASVYKMEHRAKKLGWVLDEVKLAQDRMRDQNERLEKASQTDRTEKDPDSNPTSGQETDRGPAHFGLLQSPLPESYLRRQDASPGSSPQWPFER